MILKHILKQLQWFLVILIDSHNSQVIFTDSYDSEQLLLILEGF